jgi:hypothetical protein
MANKCQIEKNLDECFVEHKGKEYLYEKNFFAFKD